MFPTVNFQFSTAVTLKIKSRSPKSSFICPKFGKNPTTGSQDIMQTRKCQAKADTDTNKIIGSTPKSICLPPLGGGT